MPNTSPRSTLQQGMFFDMRHEGGRIAVGDALAESDQRRGERSGSPRRVQPPRGPDAVDAIFAELGDPLADPFDGPPIRFREITASST